MHSWSPTDAEQNPAPPAPIINGDETRPRPKLVHSITTSHVANNEAMDEDNDDGDVVTGPTVKAQVTLAKTINMSSYSLLPTNIQLI